MHWQVNGLEDGDFHQRSYTHGQIDIVRTDSPKVKSQNANSNQNVQDEKHGEEHVANFDCELPSRHRLGHNALLAPTNRMVLRSALFQKVLNPYTTFCVASVCRLEINAMNPEQ